jgi:amino acid transporter
MKNKILFFLIPLLLGVQTLSAEEVVLPIDSKITISGLIKSLLAGLMAIAVPIMVLALIYVGFLFVKAQGNNSELKKAREALKDVLIGILIILIGYAVFQIVYTSFK